MDRAQARDGYSLKEDLPLSRSHVEISNLLTNCCFYPKTLIRLGVNRVYSVQNDWMQGQFHMKVKDMGTTSSKIRRAFVAVDSFELAQDIICKDGLKIGNAKETLLAMPSMGVCVQRFPDVLLPETPEFGRTAWLVVFKVAVHRCTTMKEELLSARDPPPTEYHCLESANYSSVCGSRSSLTTIDPDRHHQIYNATQFYIYEYNSRGKPVLYPQTLFPSHVVEYTVRRGRRPQVDGDVGSCPSWLNSLYCPQNNGEMGCLGLTRLSSTDPAISSKSFACPQKLEIDKFTSWDEVGDNWLQGIEAITDNAESRRHIDSKDVFFNYMKITGRKQSEEAALSQLQARLDQTRKAGLINLNRTREILVILTDCDLTRKLGIPQLTRGEVSFHCILRTCYSLRAYTKDIKNTFTRYKIMWDLYNTKLLEKSRLLPNGEQPSQSSPHVRDLKSQGKLDNQVMSAFQETNSPTTDERLLDVDSLLLHLAAHWNERTALEPPVVYPIQDDDDADLTPDISAASLSEADPWHSVVSSLAQRHGHGSPLSSPSQEDAEMVETNWQEEMLRLERMEYSATSSDAALHSPALSAPSPVSESQLQMPSYSHKSPYSASQPRGWTSDLSELTAPSPVGESRLQIPLSSQRTPTPPPLSAISQQLRRLPMTPPSAQLRTFHSPPGKSSSESKPNPPSELGVCDMDISLGSDHEGNSDAVAAAQDEVRTQQTWTSTVPISLVTLPITIPGGMPAFYQGVPSGYHLANLTYMQAPLHPAAPVGVVLDPNQQGFVPPVVHPNLHVAEMAAFGRQLCGDSDPPTPCRDERHVTPETDRQQMPSNNGSSTNEVCPIPRYSHVTNEIGIVPLPPSTSGAQTSHPSKSSAAAAPDESLAAAAPPVQSLPILTIDDEATKAIREAKIWAANHRHEIFTPYVQRESLFGRRPEAKPVDAKAAPFVKPLTGDAVKTIEFAAQNRHLYLNSASDQEQQPRNSPASRLVPQHDRLPGNAVTAPVDERRSGGIKRKLSHGSDTETIDSDGDVDEAMRRLRCRQNAAAAYLPPAGRGTAEIEITTESQSEDGEILSDRDEKRKRHRRHRREHHSSRSCTESVASGEFHTERRRSSLEERSGSREASNTHKTKGHKRKRGRHGDLPSTDRGPHTYSEEVEDDIGEEREWSPMVEEQVSDADAGTTDFKIHRHKHGRRHYRMHTSSAVDNERIIAPIANSPSQKGSPTTISPNSHSKSHKHRKRHGSGHHRSPRRSRSDSTDACGPAKLHSPHGKVAAEPDYHPFTHGREHDQSQSPIPMTRSSCVEAGGEASRHSWPAKSPSPTHKLGAADPFVDELRPTSPNLPAAQRQPVDLDTDRAEKQRVRKARWLALQNRSPESAARSRRRSGEDAMSVRPHGSTRPSDYDEISSPDHLTPTMEPVSREKSNSSGHPPGPEITDQSATKTLDDRVQLLQECEEISSPERSYTPVVENRKEESSSTQPGDETLLLAESILSPESDTPGSPLDQRLEAGEGELEDSVEGQSNRAQSAGELRLVVSESSPRVESGLITGVSVADDQLERSPCELAKLGSVSVDIEVAIPTMPEKADDAVTGVVCGIIVDEPEPVEEVTDRPEMVTATRVEEVIETPNVAMQVHGSNVVEECDVPNGISCEVSMAISVPTDVIAMSVIEEQVEATVMRDELVPFTPDSVSSSKLRVEMDDDDDLNECQLLPVVSPEGDKPAHVMIDLAVEAEDHVHQSASPIPDRPNSVPVESSITSAKPPSMTTPKVKIESEPIAGADGKAEETKIFDDGPAKPINGSNPSTLGDPAPIDRNGDESQTGGSNATDEFSANWASVINGAKNAGLFLKMITRLGNKELLTQRENASHDVQVLFNQTFSKFQDLADNCERLYRHHYSDKSEPNDQ